MAQPKLQYAIGNGASTTSGSSISASDTSLPITNTSSFQDAPVAGEGMVIINEGGATEEFAYSTGLSGSSLTIPLANRGLEGGSAQSHASNETVKGIITAGMWNDLVVALKNVLVQSTGALDTTKVVDLTTSQTLTNKTLSTPKVRDIYDLGNLTGAVTIDPANGDRQGGTLTGNVTGITLTAPASNKKTVLTLFLGTGAGSYTIAWTTSVTWIDGSTWGTSYYTTTASKLNVISLYFDGTNWWGIPNKFA